jgi:hypothetical protein
MFGTTSRLARGGKIVSTKRGIGGLQLGLLWDRRDRDPRILPCPRGAAVDYRRPADLGEEQVRPGTGHFGVRVSANGRGGCGPGGSVSEACHVGGCLDLDLPRVGDGHVHGGGHPGIVEDLPGGAIFREAS